ncbi:multidrug resistance-associated protein 1-like isoform X1 [Lytechinus variegatus]|uniref:multidrug resistance-associated protein 1-like isoform X1 n=1 Tax=Lytechinus variegatus TaxID=7654 RepID=UPI001BB2BA20|nr:multidrug resistance-associated protein 1-like isoform X1 [Lytechinus variegatus]
MADDTLWFEFCGSAFWDPSLLNSSVPDVTPCFQETVLSWIPPAFLLGVVPFYLLFLKHNDKGFIRISKLHKAKLCLGLLLILLPVLDVCKGIADMVQIDGGLPAVYIVTPSILAITMVVSLILIHIERRKGLQSSGVLFIFYLISIICAVAEFHSKAINAKYQGSQDAFRYVTFYLYFFLLIGQLVLVAFADEMPYYSPDIADINPCPEARASFLSVVTFWWFTSMVIRGYKKSLERVDLWSLLSRDKACTVVPEFERSWIKEVHRANRSKHGALSNASLNHPSDGQKYAMTELDQDGKSPNGTHTRVYRPPSDAASKDNIDGYTQAVAVPQVEFIDGSSKASLFRAVAMSNGEKFLVAVLLKFIHDCLIFVNPQILRLLINFTEDASIWQWRGFFYAGSMLMMSMFNSCVLHQYFHRCFIVGMHLRSSIIGVVYRKSLQLSSAARKGATVGEIVNLMSVDAQRFMDLCTYLNMLWSAPFQISVALYFLWQTLGPSVLAGLGVMILIIPINAFVAMQARKLQVKQMQYKDARIKLMSEVLSGIKVLKLYAWEESFQAKILAIRDKELKVLRLAAYLNAFTSFTWTCAPVLVSVTTFAVYVVSNENNILDAEKAFVSIALFNILRFPLTIMPNLISNIVQTSVSLKRLEKFLKNEQLDPQNVDHFNMPGHSITVDNGHFTWDREEKTTLTNINLDIKQGSLVAVVGQVGCGKSSLLSALLGEMEKIDGKVFMQGSVAYVPQQAWIQNATLRSNVIFSKDLHVTKYKHIIKACALARDLEVLPGGDMTEIGEKGINLSGGQKQRVSLARAVYANTDVYLLDDPLSAVDAHVAKHIFGHVIGPEGLLKNKTRVLVTHGISFLPQVDQIIVIVDGSVSEVGSYQDLLDQNGAFAEFLRNYSQDADEKEDEEEEEEDEDIPVNISLEDLTEDKEPIRNLKPLKGKSRKLSKGIEAISQYDIFNTPSKKADLAVKTDAYDEVVMGDKEEKLIRDEKAKLGNVKLTVFWAYIRSVGVLLSLLIVMLYMLFNIASVGGNLWLSRWSNEPLVNGTQPDAVRDKYLTIYALLGLTQGIFITSGCFILYTGGVLASRALHSHLLINVLRCAMSFYDTTLKGALINCFAKEVDEIDIGIPIKIRSFLDCILKVFSVLAVISYSTPWFMIVLPFLGVFYYIVQRFYICTSRQLKRLESVSRSPIYSHFSETIVGTSTIRAYQRQHDFIKQNEQLIDNNHITYYPNIVSNRWLALRLEFVGNCIVFFAALFAVIGRNNLSSGIVGLSISYALQITQTLNWMVRMTSELETNIVSVERVKEYSEAPTEAAAIVEDNRPAESWPGEGKVEFINYSTRYREGLDLVIKGINVTVKPGEKVGVVGRTGAGKSSLTMALFRIIEPAEGQIKIDGVDISSIGLKDLRSKITIIPQDPVLFAGALRMNLDPFESYTDDEVWLALRLSHLANFVSSLPEGLQHECAEGGENLSVGQRQLICLARALLRKSKILVLDEATAAVDLETDDLIQATIRSEFSECTVITIAHRINTIMDSTRILVMDGGEVSEFDTPTHLLTSGGIFYTMAKDAGLTS